MNVNDELNSNDKINSNNLRFKKSNVYTLIHFIF
jgi:hypothetical protein